MSDKMIFFNSRTIFNGLAISYIFNLTGSWFWLTFIIGAIFGLIILTIFNLTSSNKYVDIVVGYIFALICGIILVNMGHSLYLKETPVEYLTIFAVLGASIIAHSSEKNLIKVVNLFFCYSLFLFLLKIVGLYPYIEIDNLRPFYNLNFFKIIWGSLVVMLTSITPILCLNQVTNKKNAILQYIVSIITIATVSFLVASVLGIKEACLYRYPEYIVLKRIKFLNFINNVDSFFNFAIIVDLLFTMSASIKNIKIENKLLKTIILISIILGIVYVCSENIPLLYIYRFFPILLISLLLLRICTKEQKSIKYNKNE